MSPFCFTGWNWEELSDDNENDKGCDNGDFDESESFYAGTYLAIFELDFKENIFKILNYFIYFIFSGDSEYAGTTKDTPKQMPKALRNHPSGGRLAPTPDDFQVIHLTILQL